MKTRKDNKESIWPFVTRGLKGICPRCGKGKLFASYLKQVDKCSACGEHLGHIRADDGPAWLTILLVGHIVVPMAVTSSLNNNLPDSVAVFLWAFIGLVLVLLLLPRTKGLFINLIWKSGTGSEKE